MKKVKGQDPSKLTSKDLLESVRQARESHLERLMNNDDQPCCQDFIPEDTDAVNGVQCMNIYTRMFPKQPINTKELECLVADEEEEKT